MASTEIGRTREEWEHGSLTALEEGREIVLLPLQCDILKALGIQRGQFPENALAGNGFHGDKNVETLEDVLNEAHGVDALGHEVAVGASTEAAVVLAEH